MPAEITERRKSAHADKAVILSGSEESLHIVLSHTRNPEILRCQNDGLQISSEAPFGAHERRARAVDRQRLSPRAAS